jgi:hypothetical protein
VYVRMWADILRLGEKSRGRISVQNSSVLVYYPAEFVVARRSMFSSNSSKKSVS